MPFDVEDYSRSAPQGFALENRLHDQTPHVISFSPFARYRKPQFDRFGVGSLLTDKQIDNYIALGYYASDYKAARKLVMEKKAKAKYFRIAPGPKPAPANFRYADDGRLIYSPL